MIQSHINNQLKPAVFVYFFFSIIREGQKEIIAVEDIYGKVLGGTTVSHTSVGYPNVQMKWNLIVVDIKMASNLLVGNTKI